MGGSESHAVFDEQKFHVHRRRARGGGWKLRVDDKVASFFTHPAPLNKRKYGTWARQQAACTAWLWYCQMPWTVTAS